MAEEKPEIVYIPITRNTRDALNAIRRGRDTYNGVIRRLFRQAEKNDAEPIKRAMLATAHDDPDAAKWVANVYLILRDQEEKKAKEEKKR